MAEQLNQHWHITQGHPPQQSGYTTSGTGGPEEAVHTLDLKAFRKAASRNGLSDAGLGRAEGWKSCSRLPIFSLKSS